jgi:glycosyltransferase involved in cell wall biosynthesis
MKVLVTHPGRQHSHQIALSLAKVATLAGYWAGVPSLDRHRKGLPPHLWTRFVRYAPVALPEDRVRWAPWTPGMRRLGDLLLPRRLALYTDFIACRLFDCWVARGLPRAAADVVVACEISALVTFQRARRLGWMTVLDAPAMHHRTQDRLHEDDGPPRLRRRIRRVKDLELALADHVLTVSEEARQSYVEAGVPRERVHCVPLGVDLGLFQPETGQVGSGSTDCPTFVFAGPASRRKGLDLLLEAFARVRTAEPSARLLVIGPAGDATPLLGPPPSGVSVLGRLPQAELAARFRSADCLVLPSRNDSFGMVVAEALACGLPVLVSDHVGARSLVLEERNGWVVPAGDSRALAERMLWCARHREALHGMRSACSASAAGAGWSSYHERVAALFAALERAEAA